MVRFGVLSECAKVLPRAKLGYFGDMTPVSYLVGKRKSTQPAMIIPRNPL